MDDFNIDLLVDNLLSKAWLDLLNPHGLTQIITEDTRVTMNSRTRIDRVFVSKTEYIKSSKVIHCGNCDHFSTGLTYRGNCSFKQHHTCITYRSFKCLDATYFLTDLENLPWSMDDLLHSIKRTHSNTVPFIIPEITTDFVLKQLAHLAQNKGISLDNINSKVLKIAASIISGHLVKIINLSLITGLFPTAWKTAKVIPHFQEMLPLT